MRRVAAFAGFLYRFVVGDDGWVAVGVVAIGAATALLSTGDESAWWLPPLAVLGLLCLSLRRAIRG